MKELNWLYSLKSEVLDFLEHQKSKNSKGYYSYSYSGDTKHWNIGSSVYALKIFYILGIEKNEDIINASNLFIIIMVKFIFNKAFIASSIKHKRWRNLLNEEYKRAETRQAYSSLMLYDEIPENINYKE